MKTLISEPGWKGHRLQFVRVLTKALLDVGADVYWQLNPSAADSAEYRVHLADLADRVALAPPTPPGGVITRAQFAAVYDATRAAARAIRADRVYVPFGDGLAQVAGLRARPRAGWAGIAAELLVLRGSWVYPHTKRRWAWRAKLSFPLMKRGPFEALHMLDPLPWAWVQRHAPKHAGRFPLIPEAVEPMTDRPPAEARRTLGLPEDGRWLCVTGMQDTRKGSDLLLRAWADAEAAGKLPGDAHLLLAGGADADVRKLLKGPIKPMLDAGRVVHLDRYLTEEEHELATLAGDGTVVPHPWQVGSSGTLVRAAALRRPVLASRFGWVGWATRTFALGRAIEVRDPAAYADALAACFEGPMTMGNHLTDRFVRYHTVANHTAHWLVRARAAMNLPSDPALLDWGSLFAGEDLGLPVQLT